jgi:hypothetical protein
VSKYFQVLERLERGREEPVGSRAVEPPDRASPRPAPRLAHSVAKPVVEPSASPEIVEVALPSQGPVSLPVPEIRTRPSSRSEPLRFPPSITTPFKGFDAVFNNIEALTRGLRPMTLVLTGASATESVQAVTMGLTEYAEGKGERVLVAELREAGGDYKLVCRHPAQADGADRSTLEVNLHEGASRETLAQWREQVGPGTDIMLVLGPPLLDSVDSALLASVCDGLVMVVVNEQTHRASLTIASKRARLAKCPTLAIVVDVGHDSTPSWLRRILDW